MLHVIFCSVYSIYTHKSIKNNLTTFSEVTVEHKCIIDLVINNASLFIFTFPSKYVRALFSVVLRLTLSLYTDDGSYTDISKLVLTFTFK